MSNCTFDTITFKKQYFQFCYYTRIPYVKITFVTTIFRYYYLSILLFFRFFDIFLVYNFRYCSCLILSILLQYYCFQFSILFLLSILFLFTTFDIIPTFAILRCWFTTHGHLFHPHRPDPPAGRKVFPWLRGIHGSGRGRLLDQSSCGIGL